MIPEHILTSDFYEYLHDKYNDQSFLDDMNYVNYDEITNIEQFEEYVDDCIYWRAKNVPYIVLDYAVKNIDINIVTELEKKYGPKNDVIKKIKWCNEYSLYIDEWQLYVESKKSNYECYFKKPLDNQTIRSIYYFDGDTCDEIKLRKNLCELCEAFVINGYLDCLKYANINEYPWNYLTCASASEYGQLECLKYLHENGCPWSEETCSRAKTFECLKYAYENGCLCDQDIIDNYTRPDKDTYDEQPKKEKLKKYNEHVFELTTKIRELEKKNKMLEDELKTAKQKINL